MNAVMALKEPDINNLCGEGGQLSDKLAMTLSKYIFKAFEVLSDKDKRKFRSTLVDLTPSIELISLMQNGQHILKVQLKIKEKMGNSCILKA